MKLDTKGGPGKTRKLRLAFAVCLVAALTVACGNDDSKSSDDLTTVKVSFLDADAFVPLEAGIELGIFEKHGIDVEFVPVADGAALVHAVNIGIADWSFSVSIGAAAAAVKEGHNVEFAGMAIPVGQGFWLSVKADSGITDVSQLSGKKIGVSRAGAVTDNMARYTIANENLRDVEVVAVGSAGDVPALLSGNVDAAVIPGPKSYQEEISGNIVKLIDYAEAMPVPTIWIAKKGFANDPETREIGERMMAAWRETVEYLQANPDEAIGFYEKLEGTPREVAEQQYKVVEQTRTDTAILEEDVQYMYDILETSGLDLAGYPPAALLAVDGYQ